MPTAKPTLNVATVEALMTALGIDGYAELGRRAGIERTLVSRILRGKRVAQPSHITALARALKCPPIALMGPADEDEDEAA